MRDPVAFLLFVGLLAIVFPKGNQGDNQEELNDKLTDIFNDQLKKALEIVEQYNKAIKIWFDVLDENKDHYIGNGELSIYFKPEYVEYAFNHYDDDGDGRLNFEEHRKSYPEFDKVCASMKCL